jgi:hypothetical protein
VAGVHTLVEWHFSQLLLVVMWVVDLPVACVPLWQLTQLVVMPAWSKPVAGVQAIVLWQLLQSAVVATWPVGLPEAMVPLWQDEQVPITWV